MQLSYAHVAANFHVTDQANVAALQNLVQRHNDLLDTRVVGGHAVTYQPVGCRQALEQVNVNVQA